MSTQQRNLQQEAPQNSNPKSIKQKSVDELQNDVQAMDDYKHEQHRIMEQGLAAKAELAKRLGHELNLKGGIDLLVEKRGNLAITKASKKQFDPDTDVVLVAISIDNGHAQNETQKLSEESLLKLVNDTLRGHLPNGTHTSAISLKAMQKDNLRPFHEAFTKFTNACAWHNKTTAGQIQSKFKHPFSYNPAKYLPEEI